MNRFQKKTLWEREWEVLAKKEQKYLEKRTEKKESSLNRFLEEKIPQTLQERLDITFSKAFGLIFDKGLGIIEKTYRKDELKKTYQVDIYTAAVRENRESLKRFSRKAGAAGRKNLLFSGVEGVGLGVLGIGLPDIPIFVGMILKSLYELALHYGFTYESEKERYFILLVIRGALSYGGELKEAQEQAEDYISREALPEEYDREREIRRTAQTLSKELLYMKFLQGIPLVGAVGGIYDAVYLKNILAYGKLKYQKRFLLKHKNGIVRKDWSIEDV